MAIYCNMLQSNMQYGIVASLAYIKITNYKNMYAIMCMVELI